MFQVDNTIAIDYETTGLDWYKADFDVISMAYTMKDLSTGELKSRIAFGREEIRKVLSIIQKKGYKVIAHNITFEMGVTVALFPEITLDWYCDTARLVQLRDNGGPMEATKGARFSLDACCKRHLDKTFWDHKNEAHEWILENVRIPHIKRRELKRGWKRVVFTPCEKKPAKSKVGQYISKLPRDLLARYNILDTENTLRLFYTIVSWFEHKEIDWELDRQLYIGICHHLVTAKQKGIRVNAKKLERYIPKVVEEISLLDKAFREKFNSFLPEKFNYNSTKDLHSLFVEQLKIKPLIYTTPKNKLAVPKPSFRSAHMRQWGDGGVMLQSRRKLLKRIEHAEKAIIVSAYDGRLHPDLKATGTRTGRFAGAGGLNVQGVPRRNKDIMSSFLADKGKVFISQDLTAAEPTATCQYSKDKNYYDACFGMVGKAPYWDDNGEGILRIDDIYLMYASVIPQWRTELKKLWEKDFDGKTFQEQWLLDAEVIKKACGGFRAVAKSCVLGISYGMGAKKLRRVLKEAGMDFTLEEVKLFWSIYWETFSGLLTLNQQCINMVEAQGYIQNEFGYLNWPPSPHKAMNALIQSTISGVMNMYTVDLLARAPYAEMFTIIHDELIVQIPQNMVDDFRAKQSETLTVINEFLSWDVPVRAGFNVGENLYECK